VVNLSSRSVAWWQRVWDLHSRSRVRVRACISCKSLGQPGFYSITWAHKVRFPGSEVFSNPKKKKCCCQPCTSGAMHLPIWRWACYWTSWDQGSGDVLTY
jgi:hypothetical protein